jgi:ribosome-associated translation inhibitor RaiA
MIELREQLTAILRRLCVCPRDYTERAPARRRMSTAIAENVRMLIPPQVTFRGISRTDWLETLIRRRATRLEIYYDAISGCRVLIEPAERCHEQGHRYHVRIDLTVPGGEIAVSHNASRHAAAQDDSIESTTKELELGAERKRVEVAVRGAFDVARRRLQDYARRQRGHVKQHASHAAHAK